MKRQEVDAAMFFQHEMAQNYLFYDLLVRAIPEPAKVSEILS